VDLDVAGLPQQLDTLCRDLLSSDAMKCLKACIRIFSARLVDF
jgi:hypothetical protein